MAEINIPKIYSDPILFRKRRGDAIQPFKHIKESITIENYYAILSEIPDPYDKVKISGGNEEIYETEDEILAKNTYRVDYINGYVYFHESLANRTLIFEYLGRGVLLFPDSRVYYTGEGSFPTVREKFVDVDRSILVQKSRVDELIRANPQPSEVVDQRIDYNGKIFRVAKDRIDAEQKKIEEAYYDAKGKQFDSLKLRIDSLQLATEEDSDNQKEENVKIWASIDLVPGKIELETGKLEEKINGDISLLRSQIKLVPEQITLKVEELREWTDGELRSASSTIDMLSDEIDMKVDVDGVVSSINLTKEGVKISGDKIWLTGKTKIDDAVIKAAHIHSLDADKINAGKIRGIDIIGSRFYSETSADFMEIAGGKILLESSRGRRVEISPDGIFGYNSNDSQRFRADKLLVTSAALGTSNSNVYLAPDSTNEVRVVDVESIPSNGVASSYSYRPIRTLGVRFRPSGHGYMGVDLDLRVTSPGFVRDNGSIVYRAVRASGYKGAYVEHAGSGMHLYLRPQRDGEARVTARGTTSTYKPIRASAFRQASSIEYKTNIEPYNEKALGVIDSLSVVRYDLKDDIKNNVTDNKQLGFIAELSESIATNEKDAIDLYKLSAFHTKAIQELYTLYKDILSKKEGK